MGLFHNYTKEGKGVKKGAYKKRRFVLFFELYFRKFVKLIELNLLFVLFCLPIVTIGPAIAGYTRVLRDMSLERPVFLFSDFFEAFRKNWKQSLVMSVIDVVAVILLSFVIRYYYHGMQNIDTRYMMIPFAIAIVFSVIFFIMHYYIYLMIVTIDIPLKNIIKNSWIFFFLGFLRNIFTTLGIVVVVLLSCWYLTLAPFILGAIGFSTIGFLICFNSYPCIEKYIIEPYNAQNKNQESEKIEIEQIFTENE